MNRPRTRSTARRLPTYLRPLARATRLALGIAAGTTALRFLALEDDALLAVLEGTFFLGGVGLAATGASGFCPLYRLLGRPARSLPENRDARPSGPPMGSGMELPAARKNGRTAGWGRGFADRP